MHEDGPVGVPKRAAAILDPRTHYRRRPDLTVELRHDGECRIAFAGSSWSGGLNTLAILAAFDRPRSLREALDRLTPWVGGAQHWIDLTAEIRSLVAAGVLRDVDRPSTDQLPAGSGFADPWIHYRMLVDRTRTRAFIEALQRTVRPGDVVVDLGTGSGVLAIAAARAGAVRVHAIEASTIADLAQAMFAANGVADRVRLWRGHSTAIDLPERADVLVSETLGNEPFAERIEESLNDAAARFLKPDARVIPRTVRVVARGYGAVARGSREHAVDFDRLAAVGAESGIDVAPLLAALRQTPRLAWILPQTLAAWPALTTPTLLLGRRTGTRVAREPMQGEGIVIVDGALAAVGLHFEAELADDLVLSTVPGAAAEDNHWSSLVRFVDPPLALRAGDPVRFDYRPGAGPERLRVACPGRGRTTG